MVVAVGVAIGSAQLSQDKVLEGVHIQVAMESPLGIVAVNVTLDPAIMVVGAGSDISGIGIIVSVTSLDALKHIFCDMVTV